MTVETRQIQVSVSQRVQVVRRITVSIEAGLAKFTDSSGSTIGCCPVDPPETVFEVVTVYNRVIGGSRVTWRLVSDFSDPGPYEFRLQVSPSGVADSNDWVDAGVPAIDPAYLVDSQQRSYGMSEVIHYRIVLVSGTGTHVSRPTRPATVLPERDRLIILDIARKQQLALTTGTGVDGFLLKARRYGIRCRCVNTVTGERTNAACPICYGVGKIGGYHPPLVCTLAELPPYDTRTMTQYAEGRATVGDEVFAAAMSPGLPITAEDVWVSAGDDVRYRMFRIWNQALYRGIVIQHAAEFRRVPRSDIVYRFPLSAASEAGCEWGMSEADMAAEAVCLTPGC